MTFDAYKRTSSEIQRDAVMSAKRFSGRLLDRQRKGRHRAAQEWCGKTTDRSMMGRYDYLLGLKVLPVKNQTVASITMTGGIWSFIDLLLATVPASLTGSRQQNTNRMNGWSLGWVGRGPSGWRQVGGLAWDLALRIAVSVCAMT